MLLRLLSSVFLFATASYCVAQGLSNYEKANQAFQAGNIDESYIHLKNSLDENPDHLPSKILVGHVLGLSGYFAEAELELNEALSQGADPNLLIEPLINILMAQAKYEELNNLSNRQLTPRIEAILLSSQAVAHARLGDLERARDLHEDASDLAPNNVLVKNAYAYFLSEAGQLDTALEVINQSLNLATDQASSYIIQANIFKLRDMREAEAAALQKALSIDPKHPVVLRELIASLNAQEKFQEAKVILERTLTLSPDDPVGQLLLSWVASKLNDNDLAGETLNKLINNLSLLDDDALNNNEELLFISGMANFASNNIEVAKEDLNQAPK